MNRVIHTFWSGPSSAIAEACFFRMREINPDWEVIVHSDFSEAELCDGFDALHGIQAKTDWLRICLLCKTGGIWLDATVVCLGPVESWLDVNETRVVGFRCPIGNGSDPPILENWAFAARAGHPLLLAWKAEFARAINAGFAQYKADYDPAHHIHSHMPYLTMHGAYAKVHNPSRVLMYDSLCEKYGPYWYQRNHWKSFCLTRWLPTWRLFMFNPTLPPLLKMTGEQRRYAETAHRSVPVVPGSFMDQYLHLKTLPAAKSFLVLFIASVLALTIMVIPRRRSERKKSSFIAEGVVFLLLALVALLVALRR